MATPIKHKKLMNLHRESKIQPETKAIESFASILKMTKASRKTKTTRRCLKQIQYARRVSLDLFKPDFTSTPNTEQPKTSTPNFKLSTPRPTQREEKFQAKSLNLEKYRHFFYTNSPNQSDRQHRLGVTQANRQLFQNLNFTPTVYESSRIRQSSFVIIDKQSCSHRRTRFTEIRQTKLVFC